MEEMCKKEKVGDGTIGPGGYPLFIPVLVYRVLGMIFKFVMFYPERLF